MLGLCHDLDGNIDKQAKFVEVATCDEAFKSSVSHDGFVIAETSPLGESC